MKAGKHCCFGLLFFVSLLAIASEMTMSGRVLDPSGAVIRGAAITLARIDGGWNNSTTTNAEGEFSFSNLTPGTYRLTANSKGFAVQEKEITIRSSTNLEIILRPAAVGETVTVNADQGYQAAIIS